VSPGAATITRRLSLAPDVDLVQLLGRNDDHLRTLENALDIRIVARGHDVTLMGDEEQVTKGERAIVQLAELVRAGTPLRAGEVRAALRMLSDDADADLKSVFADAIAVPSRKKWIAPKTLGQKRYVDAIRTHDMVFGIGPAGTGKSFLAVAMAVAALMKREIVRIVLTRPAVEAGERLGFNSKMVITGDVTQIDLPSSRGSGLVEIQRILRDVPGIAFVYFSDQDVVRHQLVSAIIRAYDAHEARKSVTPSGPV
jgi:phosphate starvation-inducible protein PhoH